MSLIAIRGTLLRAAMVLVMLAWSVPAGGDDIADRAFLRQHWRRPIPPQGDVPSGHAGFARSLAPDDCAQCHPRQFDDWKTTLHARSMGPGVTGQLVEMWRGDPASAGLCLSCHAPLAEQQPVVPRDGRFVPNPGFDAGLHQAGVACAACHVRAHRRFGPPRRDGSIMPSAPPEYLAHDGATRTSAFEQSAFCASCHQFPPDAPALNGKPIQNTYEEWRQSSAARAGRQCQNCHMADRRHLWRGIHDQDMVKSGVRIGVTTQRRAETLTAVVMVKNVAAGHHFPTYVVPRVVVRVGLIDAEGAPVAGSAVESAIGRDVTLDLSREIADTRIPPGGSARLHYRRRLERPGLTLRVTVTVYPDHFYTRFFEALIESGAGAGAAQIREALETSRRSVFEIFRKDVPLT